jgi:hypothetical protein
MSYTVVFESLRELFPQIDNRILKAASIEHANNLEAAVDFILQEVIPSIPEPIKSSENDRGKSNWYGAPPEDDDSQNLYYSIVNTTPPKRNVPNEVPVNEGMSPSSSSERRNWDLSVLIANNRASSQVQDFGNLSNQTRKNGGHEIGLEEGEANGGDKIRFKEGEAEGSNGLSNQPLSEPEVITRSTHSVNPEVLEDIVSDAKSSKMNLLASVDKLTTMMKNVVHLEEKAKITKEEASTAGQNTLSKVEDLREMLLRAKETNNMHAGEVYGERSILSTEARELQSRLLSLTDDKNKSLKIMEEIHQSLEARLAAATDEIARAEKVRIEREESAQRALKEQEEMMIAIVEESKKLQQEAEENTKLRDFLVERGRAVDSLQGAIAVLCEDITQLKEIVEGRLPMTKSIASTISSLSSTSSASLNQNPASLLRNATVVNSDEKLIMTEGETRDGDGSSATDGSGAWVLFESLNP